MKRFMVCAGLLLAVGCTSDGSIRNIVRDQQFSEYKTTLEQLETDYLQKKLTYAEYLEQKKHVEEVYQKQIDSRRDLIRNQNEPGVRTEMAP